MGLWHKTLFYLGLVDEDDQSLDDPGRTAGARGGREPAAEYPGAPRREDQPARPIGGRRTPRYGLGVETEDAVVVTGEHEPVSRRGVQGRRVEPPMTMRRRTTSTDQALTDSGVVVTPPARPMVRAVAESDLESEVIVARSYSDAQTVADHLRASVPVVLDLRNVEPAMVRRLVDFSSGLTYALGGSMRKIAQGVVLVTPANVNISRDERRRLRELGYHEAPEES